MIQFDLLTNFFGAGLITYRELLQMEQQQINIIVCVKQVSDPEAPPAAFKVDEEEKKVVVTEGIPPVLSPFDENALELALKIKDVRPAQIRVISLGASLAIPVLRKCLAVGSDELILLQDNSFCNVDSYSTAYALSAAIRKLSQYHLILCGRQASDTDAGIVALGIAEILDIPGISSAKKVEFLDNEVVVTRALPTGKEVVAALAPCLVTVTSEAGELRTPELKQLLEAKKKPVTTWRLSDIGVETLEPPRSKLVKMKSPAKREGECQMIGGETPQIAGENLALELRKAELL